MIIVSTITCWKPAVTSNPTSVCQSGSADNYSLSHSLLDSHRTHPHTLLPWMAGFIHKRSNKEVTSPQSYKGWIHSFVSPVEPGVYEGKALLSSYASQGLDLHTFLYLPTVPWIDVSGSSLRLSYPQTPKMPILKCRETQFCQEALQLSPQI